MAETTGKRAFWLAGRREAAQDRFFREALAHGRWREGDAADWHTCWYTGMPGPEVFRALTPERSINHIPGNNGLTIKSNLYATLDAAHRRVVAQEGAGSEAARRLAFFPRVYAMPEDYHALQEAAREAPAKRWILKPRNAARGRGIALLQDAAMAPLDHRYMVQEYLDRPHTVGGHKYVLRLYALIASVEPLRVYLYNEGSVKLASAPYDGADPDNIYAHLTNPDINATNTESESPVVFHSLRWYREWLREAGHDDDALFARLDDMVALTTIAVRERMRGRLQEIEADTRGCYELLGFDCLVDADLRPWILECNLSPSLEVCAAPRDGGDVEEAMKRSLVADMVRLLGIDPAAPAPQATASPPEQLRQIARDEHARAGNYRRVVPAADPERSLAFFPLPRLADIILADDAAGHTLPRPRVRPWATEEIIDDGRLGLYHAGDGTLYTPNDLAAWIWLQAADGADPDAVADALVSAHREAGQPADAWALRQQVWDVLADSAVAGMLLQRGAGDPDETAPEAPERAEGTDGRVGHDQEITVAGTGFRLRAPDAPAAARLAPFAGAHGDNAGRGALSILRAPRGYALADGTALLADGLTLARLGPAVRSVLLARGMPETAPYALDGVLVPLGPPPTGAGACPAVLVISRAPATAGEAAVAMADALGTAWQSGLYPEADDPAHARSAGLPALVPPGAAGGPPDALPGGEAVRLLAPTMAAGSLVYAVDRVAVVGERPDAEKNGRDAPAAVVDVLAALLPALTMRGDDRPSTRQVRALTAWLEACERRFLAAGDDAGARAMAVAFRDGAVRPA